MATGTGKTKTCIALIYRLLKTQRFHRVLFLVDRSALGEQAANAFKDTRMENLNTFASIFGIKELEEAAPESDTKVHIATVQGMVQRLFNVGDDTAPAVDTYDCIVVDECHRGYLQIPDDHSGCTLEDHPCQRPRCGDRSRQVLSRPLVFGGRTSPGFDASMRSEPLDMQRPVAHAEPNWCVRR
jgi:replicative superfamily II helicase